jgi:predicted transcriptional regulator of viral defense system
METISKQKAIQILIQKKISLLDISTAQKIFSFQKENSLYKFLQRLEKANLLKRVVKGKYLFSLKEINDYELANLLLTPSYLSLESALSFYGILAQFPYTITSVTPLKTKKSIYNEKEFEFAHLKKEYFFGYVKKDNFLIALPEKALLDELYFISKGLIRISLDELNLSLISRNKLGRMMEYYKFLPLENMVKKYVK